jgi:ABC-type glycerol-3-phosphate transport system permease component
MRPDASRRRVLGGYAAAILLATVMLLPFAWMLSTALMEEFEVFQYPPPLLPASPQWRNFPNALTQLPSPASSSTAGSWRSAWSWDRPSRER